ncbi:unnamed protein product [Linum trigynum]|uniref:Uncharacterized protein n=1 Tax=Linum trigynum TaxID=586398 RepID=A0AAV2CR16_9ROSI
MFEKRLSRPANITPTTHPSNSHLLLPPKIHYHQKLKQPQQGEEEGEASSQLEILRSHVLWITSSSSSSPYRPFGRRGITTIRRSYKDANKKVRNSRNPNYSRKLSLVHIRDIREGEEEEEGKGKGKGKGGKKHMR